MSERNRNRTLKKSSVNSFINYGIVIAAYIAIQAAIAGGVASNSIQSLLVPACCYIVMAVSLNLTVGILGELSLGHAGFMSLGAFSGIITATALQSAIPSAPLRLALAMVVGGVMGGIGGTIVGVPVLRLRGDYLDRYAGLRGDHQERDHGPLRGGGRRRPAHRHRRRGPAGPG